VTDHIRSTVFLVSDGVIPSNEGRGYVLRRLLRRAARHGKLLGISKMFLTDLADIVISQSKDAYPELFEKQDYIKKVITIEEKKFYETIDSGIVMLNDYIAQIKKEHKTVLDGEIAFKLHDTYGFPLDLTKEIIAEQGISLDEEKFNKAMENQKEMARSARGDTDTAGWESEISKQLKDIANCEFIGYDKLECDAKILVIVQDGKFVKSISQGEKGTIITDKTAFYAESGGQAGDIGNINTDSGMAKVIDTVKYSEGKVGHTIIVEAGEIKIDTSAKMLVDKENRMAITRNHSATHLLQKSLKIVLGNHINQAGSYVTAERLRFDFSHFEAMTVDEISKVSDLVNHAILDSLEIKCEIMSADEAKKTGAMALFGEKYGDKVRVVSMGEYSKELCGGTHLKNTAQVGLFKIVSESGVAAGVRRIEAVSGTGFLALIKNREEIMIETARILKTNNILELSDKAKKITDELKEQKQIADSLRAKLSQGEASEILENAKEISGIKLIIANKDKMNIDAMRLMCDDIKGKMEKTPVVIILAGTADDKITFLASANKLSLEKGIHSGNIIKEITKIAGGSGGGKPDMAQGGGKDFDKINIALDAVAEIIKSQIK
jgi:alanyl-tRNA synthetase